MKVSDDIFTAHGREFFDLSPSLFSIVGTDGCFKALSAGWQRALGWKTAKLLDRPFMDFVHPDDATNTRIVFEKMLADMPVSEHRNRYRCANGTYRWLHWTWTLHLEAELIYTVATDITDAKAAEETRSRLVSEIERRSRQQALLVRLAQRVLEAPVNGETIAFTASVVTQALGVPYGKIFALENDGLLHLVGGHALPEGVVGSYAAGELDDVHAHRTLAANAPLVVNYARETSVPKSDLAARCGIVTGATVAIGREPAYGVIGAYDTVERDFTADDIAFLEACALTLATAFQARDQETARTEIEIALRESEAQYRRFFDLNPSPSWICDAESYRILEVNERAIELYGYTREEWLSMSTIDIRTKEEAERLVREVADAFEGVQYWGGWRHLKKDGTSISVEVHSSCIEWNGRPAHLVVVHDRTAEERAQEVAQKQARELSEVLDGMTNAFVALDRDWRIAYVNGRASQLLQHPASEMLGKRVTDVFPEARGSPFDQQLQRAATTKQTVGFIEFFAPLQTWFEVTAHPSRDGLAIYFRGANDEVASETALRESEARLRLLASEVPAILWHVDKDLRILSIDGSVASELTVPVSELIGKPIGEYYLSIAGYDGTTALAAHHEALQGRSSTCRIVSGEKIFQFRVEPLFDASGTIDGAAGIAIDITSQERSEEILRESQRQLAAAQAMAHLGSWEESLEDGSVTCSDELLRLLELPENPSNALPAPFETFVHPEDRERFTEIIRNAREHHRPFNIEHRVQRPGGAISWLQTTGEFRFDAGGRATRLIGAALDISDRRIAEAQLTFMANYDALTGLYNRRALVERLDGLIAERAGTSRALHVFLLDLDGFKAVNDTLGHAFGDELLRAIAQRLRKIQPQIVELGRVGGDEFVIGAADLDADGARSLADRIIATFAQPFHVRDREHFIEASIGISAFPQDDRDAAGLIQDADSAMYQAKKERRSAICFFQAEMQEGARLRMSTEHGLHFAVERNEFVLHFQPFVDIKTGDIVGAEALVRWQHPSAGLLDPDGFIGIAEDSGQIVGIGRWVVREAAAACARWQRVSRRPFRMAVNVSAKQLVHPDFITDITTALALAALPPNALELELTETAVVHDTQHAISVLSELRAIGVRSSIDDFGTGYSSLSYLKRLPVDVVKIDRVFIREIETDLADRTLARAILDVAHGFGLKVIAEGIETVDQYRLLRFLGCDEAQGYYISKPLPAEEFERLLRSAVHVVDDGNVLFA